MNIEHLIGPHAASAKQSDQDLYQALRLISAELTKAQRRIASLLGSTTTTLESGIVVSKFKDLTADWTVPVPSEPPGTVFIYVFHQPAAATWTVTFPPEFIGMFPGPQTFAPNSWSSFAFFKKTPSQLITVLTGIESVRPA